MKIYGRKGQGHCLTFDPGTTISLQFQTFPQKPISQLQPYSQTSIIRSVRDRQIFFQLSVVRIYELITFQKCSVVFVRYQFSTV